jgi:hypothetical protein
MNGAHVSWVGVPVAAVALLLAGTTAGVAGTLSVVSVQPAPHSLGAPVHSAISVGFDRPVDPSSIGPGSFWAMGRWSGPVSGAYSLADGGHTVTLQPARRFSAGETVLVVLSHDIVAVDGSPLRSAGWSFQFWTAAEPAALDLSVLDTMTTRSSPEISTRAYGGIATDLDNDGFCDLTIVNEETADLRVFKSFADGTGLFDDFIVPPFPVGPQASPCEPGDFDRDGFADICVANISEATVSVLLGNGDGTYGPEQVISVGLQPRGIAVLDADGDGDLDIVNTNASSGNVSITLNDGSGVFGPPSFFEGGGLGEWSLAAADMDDDQILDLVIGARSAGTIIVRRGNGDGTFSFVSSQNAGGATWMLSVGDVDGDGDEDVASANSTQNNGAILLGDGQGGLAAPVLYPTDPFPLATDLGDLDGDGDLDWVTSSFAGDWGLFLNGGAGAFAFARELPAPQAASCALAVDIDNDCDLDLALVDELADVVILQTNGGPSPAAGDLDLDCRVGITDLLALLSAWGPCGPPCPPGCPGDIDGDCAVGITDLLALLASWG